MTNKEVVPQPRWLPWTPDTHVGEWRWVALGWVRPATNTVMVPPAGITNDKAREMLLDNGWTPDRSRIACIDCEGGGNKRCTYDAFVSFFSEADQVSFEQVIIPTIVPERLRGTYLWWQVGSYSGRFPMGHPL